MAAAEIEYREIHYAKYYISNVITYNIIIGKLLGNKRQSIIDLLDKDLRILTNNEKEEVIGALKTILDSDSIKQGLASDLKQNLVKNIDIVLEYLGKNVGGRRRRRRKTRMRKIKYRSSRRSSRRSA